MRLESQHRNSYMLFPALYLKQLAGHSLACIHPGPGVWVS